VAERAKRQGKGISELSNFDDNICFGCCDPDLSENRVFLLLIIAGVNFILVVIASIRAFNGETYSYPFKIQLIKK